MNKLFRKKLVIVMIAYLIACLLAYMWFGWKLIVVLFFWEIAHNIEKHWITAKDIFNEFTKT